MSPFWKRFFLIFVWLYLCNGAIQAFLIPAPWSWLVAGVLGIPIAAINRLFPDVETEEAAGRA